MFKGRWLSLFTATKINVGQDFKEGKYTVTFYTKESPMQLYEELQDIDNIDVEAKKHRNKRSLDANAYCWVLCDKIAKKIGNTTKEDIYKEAISYVGVFEPMIAQEKSFEKFKQIWEKQGLGYLVKEVSRKDKCVKVLCYYGSSSYDSKEMSILIEFLINAAKEQGIETMPEAELKSLLEEWH